MLRSLIALSLCLTLAAAPAFGAELGVITDFKLADTDGAIHSAADWTGRKAVVLIFLGTECPVSNGYAPEIERIYQSYKNADVAFLGVYAEPSVTKLEATAHGKEYGLTFPRLLDIEQHLAKQAGVKKIPTTIVLNASGKILYRGRIDDRWSPEGRRRDVPRTRELRDAVEAVVAGREPAVSEATPFGCPLPTIRAGK